MSMTTFGSRLSTCYRVLQKERLLTYGVISPGQSRGISPLQGGGGTKVWRSKGASLEGGFGRLRKASWRGLQRGLKGAWRRASRGLEGGFKPPSSPSKPPSRGLRKASSPFKPFEAFFGSTLLRCDLHKKKVPGRTPYSQHIMIRNWT